MAYFVSIGQVQKRRDYGRPQEQWEDEAHDLQALPFAIDTLEQAQTIIAISKSPAWTIQQGETDGWLRQAKEIACSSLVQRTRELDQQEREAAAAAREAQTKRINDQPREVVKVYAGIPVTFQREPPERRPGDAYGRLETRVTVSALGKRFHSSDYITKSGAIQKKKWEEQYSKQPWAETDHSALIPLAPHLKDIQAVADSLSKGAYKEEA